VQRIRRECGLRVKRWQRRPRRRGRSTGTIPTRAERLNHVWSWDFVADRTDNGGKLRILTVIDEYSRECLALHVARKLTAEDLIEVMERLVAERGAPAHMRSDNGSEFIARILQKWLAERQVKTLYIDPGSPWQTGMSRASTVACATNASTGNSCSAWPRTASSSRITGGTTTTNGPTAALAIARQPRPVWKLLAPVALRAPYAKSLNPPTPLLT
jgi:hypothetical protein